MQLGEWVWEAEEGDMSLDEYQCYIEDREVAKLYCMRKTLGANVTELLTM